MRNMLGVILFLMMATLAACSPRAMLDRLADKQDQAMADSLLRAIKDGNANLVTAPMHPQVRAFLDSDIRRVQAIYPPDGVPSLVNAAWQTATVDGRSGKVTLLSYEIGAHGKWSGADIRIFESSGQRQIVSVYLMPLPEQPSAANAFTFAGSGAANYAFLLAMTLSVVTCITGIVLAIRNTQLKRRWLWALGSAIALGTFELNWTTGAFSFQPISFLLLGASGTRVGLVAPWTFKFGLPIIAVIVIAKYLRRHRVEADTFAGEA